MVNGNNPWKSRKRKSFESAESTGRQVKEVDLEVGGRSLTRKEIVETLLRKCDSQNVTHCHVVYKLHIEKLTRS